MPYGVAYDIPELSGDVSVERVPSQHIVSTPEFEDDHPALLKTRKGEYWLAWVAYKTIARKGPYIEGGDQILLARSRDGASWSKPVPLTAPGGHFRVALAEDGKGRVFCVYGTQKKMESGNFDLYARMFDGQTWSSEQALSSDPRPDAFHRLASDPQGNLYLVWMGFRPGPAGGPAQSDILMRVWNGERWGDEVNVSQSPDDDWEPAIATDSFGGAWIAWDSYRTANGPANGPANYDVLLRSYSHGSLGPVRAISATPFAEMRADVAVDGSDRVWIAWEEGGVNWGKDTGYENPKHRIRLRRGGTEIYGPANSRTLPYRRPRVAVLDGDRLMEPAADLTKAYPSSLQANLFQNPRLGTDGSGRRFIAMSRGSYEIRMQSEGFASQKITVKIADRSPAPLRIILKLADIRQEVTVTDSANQVNTNGGINSFPANNYDLSGEWARADYDQRHRLNLLGTIRAGKYLEFGVGFFANTGAPYTETTGRDDYRTGYASARPIGVRRKSLRGGLGSVSSICDGPMISCSRRVRRRDRG